MRGPWAAVLAAGALAAACGGSDEEPPPRIEGTPKEQVAQTVNAFFDAWNGGNGAAACALATERGQTLVVRIARRFADLEAPIDPSSCEEAVERSAAAIEQRIGQVASPDRVRIEGPIAYVTSELRGEMKLREEDGAWRVVFPAFLD